MIIGSCSFHYRVAQGGLVFYTNFYSAGAREPALQGLQSSNNSGVGNNGEK